MNNPKPWQKLFLACTASTLLALSASAQSSDAIIDKLVEKGILTVKEANDLREEADKNFNQAYSVKNGMSDWVNALKFNGDVRVRYEGFYSDAKYIPSGRTNAASFLDRNRFRYRIRFGVVASLADNLEAGFKITSADTAGGFTSGNPISGNSTMQDNGSKKFVFIDQAYVRWSPFNGPDWTSTLTLGKMENPFVIDDMVLDQDYTPEGAAIQLGYRINDQHSLKLNGVGFILDEIDISSNDPYLVGAQLRWDAAWLPKFTSSLGASALSILSGHNLTNGAVPNVNRGNTRNADGTPKYDFNVAIVDGALTYNLDSFPCYKGPFPVQVRGEYMNNFSAPHSADNYAWNAGVVLGKSGKRGTWEISYMYKWLGANSWWEELPDDDFSAFYGSANSPPNSGSGIGIGGGTGVKGHVIRFAYSPTDSLTLSLKWYATDLIHSFPAGSESTLNRIQVDGMLKF